MIRIDNVSRRWKDFEISNVSLEVREGEFFVILGPTGSGKTLLLEMLAGFYEPDKGSIEINGSDITGLSPDERDLSFVYQDYMLFPHMNVEENIRYGLKMRGVNKKTQEEKVEEMAEMVNIDHLLNRSPTTLSGGEKQRVSLARALVLDPKVLLLDEPFGSLDYQTARELRKLVKELHHEFDTTIIHVTHDQEEALVMGDRLAVMNDGRIIRTDQPEKIMRKPGNNFVAEFVGAGNIFKGKAERKENTWSVDLGPIDIVSTSGMKGDVTVTIRPEDIILAEQSFQSSARNVFEGKVTEITDRGNYHEVTIDIGVPIMVYITKHSVDDLGLQKGKNISLMFKASAVHVFKE